MRRSIAKQFGAGFWLNSVDDPPHCDFYFGSVVRRGDLQIAISTAGEAPLWLNGFGEKSMRGCQRTSDHGSKISVSSGAKFWKPSRPGEARKALLHAAADRQFFEASPALSRV